MVTCVIRTSTESTGSIREALQELPAVLEPVGPALDLRATWGMRASLIVAAVDGMSAVARLQEAGIAQSRRARCLAVEVGENGVGRVIGDASNDPMGTSLWVQSCVQYRSSAGVAGARALRRCLNVGHAGGFKELQLGKWAVFTRWDDVMTPHGRTAAARARQCIQRAELAGLRFEACAPECAGNWDGCDMRSVAMTRRISAGSDTLQSCGAQWLGDSEPIQLSLNVDASGERVLVVGARTWTPVGATRGEGLSDPANMTSAAA
jgi:hypothetical protein